MESGFIYGWLLFGAIAGVIGARKGEGPLAFVVGAILGPLGVLVALASNGKRIKCPFCQEMVNKDATVCKHCHSSLAKSA